MLWMPVKILELFYAFVYFPCGTQNHSIMECEVEFLHQEVVIPMPESCKRKKKCDSKFFKHLLKCLKEGRHPHMLYNYKNEENMFVVKYVNKKSPKWEPGDISLFKDCDDLASLKVRGEANYEEKSKGRFKANMVKCVKAKRVVQMEKKRISSCVTLMIYKILCDLPMQLPENQVENVSELVPHEKVGKKINSSSKFYDLENKVNSRIQNISHFSCLSENPELGKSQTEGQESYSDILNGDGINGNKDLFGGNLQQSALMKYNNTEGKGSYCYILNEDGINGNKDLFGGNLQQSALMMKFNSTEGQESYSGILNEDGINGNKGLFDGNPQQYVIVEKTFNVDEEGSYTFHDLNEIMLFAEDGWVNDCTLQDDSEDGIYDKTKMTCSNDPFLPNVYSDLIRTCVEDHQRSPSMEGSWRTNFINLENMKTSTN